MTQSELHTLLDQLLRTWENEVVEFKSGGSGFSTDDIGEYFSALSNEANLRQRDRAWLVFGVDNKTMAVKGTSYRPEAREAEVRGAEVRKAEVREAQFQGAQVQAQRLFDVILHGLSNNVLSKKQMASHLQVGIRTGSFNKVLTQLLTLGVIDRTRAKHRASNQAYRITEKGRAYLESMRNHE